MSKQAVRQIELKQICFIDDSKTSAYVTKKLLKQQGYAVDHFPDAESALEVLMENAYDLVITDLMISADGGVNGDDLIRLIRHSGHPTKSTIPIMVVTGASDLSIHDELMLAGANKVLYKPLDGYLLQEAIQALIPRITHFESSTPVSEDNNATTDSKKTGMPHTTGSADSVLMDLDLGSQSEESFSHTHTAEPNYTQQLLDAAKSNEIIDKADAATSYQQSNTKKSAVNHTAPETPRSSVDTSPSVSLEVGREASDKVPDKVQDKAPSKASIKAKTLPKNKAPSADKLAAEKMSKQATSDFDIPVLTRIASANDEVEEKNADKDFNNQSISEQIEKLVEQELEAKISNLTLQSLKHVANVTGRENPQPFVRPSSNNVDIHQSPVLNKLKHKSDEISPSMRQSIQNELIQIDEQVAEKGESQDTSVTDQPSAAAAHHTVNTSTNVPLDPPVSIKNTENAERTAAPQPSSVPESHTKTTQSVVTEPAVKPVQIVADDTPKKTVKPKQPEDENNPLLDLLNHMEDPDLGDDFTGKKTSKQTSMPTRSGSSASKFVWFFLLLVMIVPAGVFWYLSQQVVNVNVIEVVQMPIHSEISVPGRVISKRNIKVSSRAAGQVMGVKIKEGDTVKKDQTMVNMDDQEAKSNVKRAQARLMSSQEEVASTNKTQQRLQRALDLGAVARQIVEDAEAAWKFASAKQTEIEEELISAQLKLDRLQIKAPFKGLITSVSVQEGQWVSLAEEILTLVDMDQRVVEIRVDVSDSARLNIGQEVVLSSEAFAGQTWKETILKIGEEVKTEDSANIIKVQTSLGLDAPKLRIGQQVDAEIRVASRNNALTLPHNVLFTHEGAPHAAVIENGKIVFIPVVTGIESITHVEVVRGLRVNQEIIVPTGLPLEPGMNTAIINNNLNPG